MLSLPLGAAGAREGDEISRSFRAAKGGTLTLRSNRGSVEVQTAAIEEVTVMVSRRVRWAATRILGLTLGSDISSRETTYSSGVNSKMAGNGGGPELYVRSSGGSIRILSL